MRAVELADVTYSLTPVGDGPPIVFLHGFTGSASEWAPFLDGVARTRTAVAIDLLGHGASSRPTDPQRYALERQAADVAAVVERLGAGPAVVVGYSYGARIALRLTVDDPGAIAGLVLESPSAGIADAAERDARRAADAAWADDLERGGIDAFVERWTALPLFVGERRLPGPVRDELARRRRANDPAVLAAALRGAGQGAMAPLHDRLATIAAPTAIVAGADDLSGLARARLVAAGIPGATLEVLEGVGHAPHREAPDRFAAWLAAALDRMRPARAMDPRSQLRSSA